MKRIAMFLSTCFLAVSLCAAQDSMQDPTDLDADAGVDSTVKVPDAALLRNLERESTTWASDNFAAFVQDSSMCDVGTALYEDALRSEAMRDHPDWPIWAVDLALEEARDAYLRDLLFNK